MGSSPTALTNKINCLHLWALLGNNWGNVWGNVWGNSGRKWHGRTLSVSGDKGSWIRIPPFRPLNQWLTGECFRLAGYRKDIGSSPLRRRATHSIRGAPSAGAMLD